jgi:hypothetical protein
MKSVLEVLTTLKLLYALKHIDLRPHEKRRLKRNIAQKEEERAGYNIVFHLDDTHMHGFIKYQARHAYFDGFQLYFRHFGRCFKYWNCFFCHVKVC